ncbi:hypothetical protein WA026_000144 [Henosepilachna vigintioctopunctata]|uniref:Thioredoxin domain-containing protein n=1 Tax=Henosepilachna vigintioctopunctata TaxID=420089 RepID=A0AAW1V390_9CUCU
MFFIEILAFLTVLCIFPSFLYGNDISSNDLTPETESLPKVLENVENDASIPTEDVSPNTTINVKWGTSNLTTAKNETIKVVQCSHVPYDNLTVQIVNDTELIRILTPNSNITSRDVSAPCVLVLFYSKYGTFSSMAAPHFNALPRAFPTIQMVAINAMMYHLFNTQNGIVGIPSLLLFHNGKPVAKFNDPEYTLDLFSKFVTRHTGVPAKEKSIVTSADFAGPVTSSPSKGSDIFLVISWLFVIFCAMYYFTKSSWWRWILETVQNNWRDSEDQAEHLHND